MAVAVQLDPIGKTALEVIQREWPLGMSSDLHSLPRTQVSVNVPFRLSDFPLHRFERRIKIDVVLVGMRLEIGQTPLQFDNRFFEIEWLNVHANRESLIVTS